ncbi:MFS general substrate transporter [Calocera viscosa TUFC12733]|uniref:MFS general substrate transporter n=1 Tax=Calocera viscosa (strain TUFC12733) TaxID=1330018 RepID=A0A167MJE9_CALVF|nr:MFS general substrate transporter [Calocera viscosa TUFC12733]
MWKISAQVLISTVRGAHVRQSLCSAWTGSGAAPSREHTTQDVTARSRALGPIRSYPPPLLSFLVLHDRLPFASARMGSACKTSAVYKAPPFPCLLHPLCFPPRLNHPDVMSVYEKRNGAPAVDPGELRGGLEDFEKDDLSKPPFILNWTEIKLIGIAGVGFFLDAYDLFIINQVTSMLQWRFYGGKSLPSTLSGLVKAAANIGSVIGQVSFGIMGDYFGRKAMYGKELMIIIVATILCISAPSSVGGDGVLIWLSVWRIVLGIGVGADYPMSASVTSDRAIIRKRGSLLCYIFANQGWGSFVGSLVTMIVLACYKGVLDNNDSANWSKTDGIWRIIVGLALIPAFGTLYQRLTLPESVRYTRAIQHLPPPVDASLAAKGLLPDGSVENGNGDLENGNGVKSVPAAVDTRPGFKQTYDAEGNPIARENPDVVALEEVDHANVDKNIIAANQRHHWKEFRQYFGQWRHLKILIGTTCCWFLLDIAFYGINLNTNLILTAMGLGGSTGTAWNRLFQVATGNLIVTALGFVPGYYVSVLTIEYIGRKPIQIMGFAMTSLMLALLAGLFSRLDHGGFIALFTFLQFFFNFGANTTTFIYPVEVFPTKYRATAHGISAACGKCGAIAASFGFNSLVGPIGTANVLWIFFGVSILGIPFTFLLPETKDRDPDVILAEEEKAGLAPV